MDSRTLDAHVALGARLDLVAAAHRRARSAHWIRIVLLVAFALAVLPMLLGGVFGAVWFAAHHIAKSVALVVVVFLGTTALISLLLFRVGARIVRIREDAVPAFEDAFYDTVAVPSLSEVLRGGTVSGRRVEDVELLHGARLFSQQVSTFEGRELFDGQTNGVRWRVQSLRVHVVDASGRVRDRRRTFFRVFQGVLVHVALPVAAGDSIRIASLQRGPDRQEYRPIRPSALRPSAAGESRFDQEFYVVTDSGSDPVPVVPERLREACRLIRDVLGRSFFLSLNESGISLALMIPEPLPLEPTVYAPVKPKRLAADLEWMGRLPAVVETLHRAPPGTQEAGSAGHSGAGHPEGIPIRA